MAEITVYPATLRWAVKTSNADPAAVAANEVWQIFQNG